MYSKILNYLKINDSLKTSKNIFLCSFIISIASYYLLIIYGYTSPDGIIEGLTYFTNSVWALQGCGRWLIKYINLAFGNIVSPLLGITFNSICFGLSTILLSKMWVIKKDINIYLISMILSTSPTIIFLMTYTYNAACFGMCVLLAITFAYVANSMNNFYSFLLGSLLICLLLGTYQAFLGVASLATLLTILKNVIDNQNYTKTIKKSIIAIFSALMGAIEYFIILKLFLNIYDLKPIDANRLYGFELNKIFDNFFVKLLETYTSFLSYFNDPIFKRRYIYILIFIILIISFILIVKKQIKEKRYMSVAFVMLLLLLIPIATNLLTIIVPYYSMYIAMEYQYTLFIPFAISIIDNQNIKLLNIGIDVLSVLLVWTLVLSANATYRSYKLSYDAINNEMQMIINDIYHTDGYVKNETPIVMVGFPNDDVLKENLPIYHYAINFPKNPVFWEDMTGATVNRYYYFLNYFGIDAGEVDYELYERIISNSGFSSMNIWPESDSIKMIDDILVLKLTDNPIIP